MTEGGDKRTPRARVDIAQREQQIVALKLRGIHTPDIARVIGITPRAVHAAFKKALHRETSRDIHTHHRVELAKLDMEEANVWRAMDANKADWQVQMSGTSQLRGIHIRRAHLLGLDAPTKLDVRGLYQTGESESSEERRETERTWLAMPREERARIYDSFADARKRLNAPIETTATESIGPDNRNDDGDFSDEE
jgi:DNA-binding CsgD family transcriptional regulator